jgi:hypothetical protein
MLHKELVYAVVQRKGLHHLFGEIWSVSSKRALRTCCPLSARRAMLLRFGLFHRLKMPPRLFQYKP